MAGVTVAGMAMAYARTIHAPPDCTDCTAIRYLCLSDGRRLTREQTFILAVAGARITSGSEYGPALLAATREGTHYVRTEPNDTPRDNLLRLPRGC